MDDVRSIISEVKRDQVHQRLQTRYDGDGNMPKYDSVEVEDYAQRHGFGGNYEAAFRDMYFDEFVDATRRASKNRSKPVSSAKPNAAVKEKPMTIDDLRKQLREDPASYEKLAKDPRAFDKLIASLTEE